MTYTCKIAINAIRYTSTLRIVQDDRVISLGIAGGVSLQLPVFSYVDLVR